MCASTSSEAAASAAEAGGSPPSRAFCANFQEPPTTSKRAAAAASQRHTGNLGEEAGEEGSSTLSNWRRTLLSKPAGRGSRRFAFCMEERTDSSACRARPQVPQLSRWRPNSAARGASSSPSRYACRNEGESSHVMDRLLGIRAGKQLL